MEKLGERIKKIRTNKNLTLRYVGESLNMDYSHLSKIERGDRTPSIDLLEKLAVLFDVPISYFFGEEQKVPKELEEVGVEWISFSEEMKNKNLTPEEIKKAVELVNELKKKL